MFFIDKFFMNSFLINKIFWFMSGVIDWFILEVFVDGGVESVMNIFFSM